MPSLDDFIELLLRKIDDKTFDLRSQIIDTCLDFQARRKEDQEDHEALINEIRNKDAW